MNLLSDQQKHKNGGRSGIRTHGTHDVQRFSRPPQSTALPSFRSMSLLAYIGGNCNVYEYKMIHKLKSEAERFGEEGGRVICEHVENYSIS